MNRKAAEGFHCPRWAELPSLPLYMDQVILVLEEAIGIFADGKERVVTASMVNNYVKHGLVQAPDRKKYGREQLAELVVVSVMKRVLSMNEITDLVRLCIGAYGIQQGYDQFCDKLEAMLKSSFNPRGGQGISPPQRTDAASVAMQAALQALMGKLVLQSVLRKLPKPQPDARTKKEKAQA